MEDILKQISLCMSCDKCIDVCPTWKVTGEASFSPESRLQTVSQIMDECPITDEMIESLYNCTKCMACESVCPADIKVSAIVAAGRQKVVEKGLGPLPRGKRVIEGILKTGNSVSGDPAKRLNWMPEPFEERQSETLLYLGCLPSYLVKDAARDSYLLLKRLGVDFMILEDEGCCGTYIYEAGDVKLAKDYFSKNVERFVGLGVKKIIVPCNGCLKCFKYFYPEVLGSIPFQVVHLVEAVYDELNKNPREMKKIERTLVYQDACRLARTEKMTEEPRELLSMCGAEVKDMELNRENAGCCGSGAGVRSLYRDLSDEISLRLLKTVPGNTVVSPCPFCTFQLGSASRDMKLQKEIVYFSKILLESLIS